MNPDTDKFEKSMNLSGAINLSEAIDIWPVLFRPDGSLVPKHCSMFQIGETVVIKNYTFKVAYVGENAILFEPVSESVIGDYFEKREIK